MTIENVQFEPNQIEFSATPQFCKIPRLEGRKKSSSPTITIKMPRFRISKIIPRWCAIPRARISLSARVTMRLFVATFSRLSRVSRAMNSATLWGHFQRTRRQALSSPQIGIVFANKDSRRVQVRRYTFVRRRSVDRSSPAFPLIFWAPLESYGAVSAQDRLPEGLKAILDHNGVLRSDPFFISLSLRLSYDFCYLFYLPDCVLLFIITIFDCLQHVQWKTVENATFIRRRQKVTLQ